MGIDIKVIPDHNVLLQLLATLVLFLVMRAKLFKPIQKLLNDRKAYIRSNIEESENKKEEAANMQNEYEEQLKQAKIEAREIVAEAKKRRDEIVSKAETEAKEEATCCVRPPTRCKPRQPRSTPTSAAHSTSRTRRPRCCCSPCSKRGSKSSEALMPPPRRPSRSEEHSLNSSHRCISYAVFCLKKKK